MLTNQFFCRHHTRIFKIRVEKKYPNTSLANQPKSKPGYMCSLTRHKITYYHPLHILCWWIHHITDLVAILTSLSFFIFLIAIILSMSYCISLCLLPNQNFIFDIKWLNHRLSHNTFNNVFSTSSATIYNIRWQLPWILDSNKVSKVRYTCI